MSNWHLYYPKTTTLNSVRGVCINKPTVDFSVARNTSELVVLIDYYAGFNLPNLSQTIKEHRASRNLPLKVIIDHTFENGLHHLEIDRMLEIYDSLGIKPENVLLLVNDAILGNGVYVNTKCQVASVDLFALSAVHRCLKLGHPISKIPVSHRPAKLNLLLGKLKKPLRAQTVYEFYKQGLLESTQFSLLGNITELQHTLDVDDHQFFKEIQPYIKSIDNVPTINTSLGTSSEGWAGSSLIYDTSSVSYIVETHDDVPYSTVYSSDFHTEKTYRPIINRHPFVLQGTGGSLERLRTRGFRTFSKYIDESYDRYQDHSLDRIRQLVTEANNLAIAASKYPNEIQEIVDFNFNQLQINASRDLARLSEIIENFLK